MVVRALKSLGRDNARVNERHDIVIDIESGANTSTFKISGSAYKLTRLRSLHHGTCLLRSPNLSSISGLLRSPAEPFIKARGVESVRSPVRNVDIDNADFEAAVLEQFGKMYGEPDVKEVFDADALEVQKVRTGYEELQSRGWIWGQTPHFTFSTYPTEDDPRERPNLPFDVSYFGTALRLVTNASQVNLQFQARHGIIEKLSIQGHQLASANLDPSALVKKTLYDFDNWADELARVGVTEQNAIEIGIWVNNVMGTELTKPK
jgi:lipoate-protein ligase A